MIALLISFGVLYLISMALLWQGIRAAPLVEDRVEEPGEAETFGDETSLPVRAEEYARL